MEGDENKLLKLPANEDISDGKRKLIKNKIRLAVLSIAFVFITVVMLIVFSVAFVNRWHKVSFTATEITALKIGENEYSVKMKIEASNWFYDFDSYRFSLITGTNENRGIVNYSVPSVISVDRKHKENFDLNFIVKDKNSLNEQFFYAVNVTNKKGKPEWHDIKIFLRDYEDVLERAFSNADNQN